MLRGHAPAPQVSLYSWLGASCCTIASELTEILRAALPAILVRMLSLMTVRQCVTDVDVLSCWMQLAPHHASLAHSNTLVCMADPHTGIAGQVCCCWSLPYVSLMLLVVSIGAPLSVCPLALQVQEPEEEDAVYLRRQQAAVDEINKRGLTLFHASVQVRPQAQTRTPAAQCCAGAAGGSTFGDRQRAATLPAALFSSVTAIQGECRR